MYYYLNIYYCLGQYRIDRSCMKYTRCNKTAAKYSGSNFTYPNCDSKNCQAQPTLHTIATTLLFYYISMCCYHMYDYRFINRRSQLLI